MKKITTLFLLIILLNMSLFADEIFDFVTTNKTKVFDPDNTLRINKDDYHVIEKDKLVRSEEAERNFLWYSLFSDTDEILFYLLNEELSYVSINNLKPINTETVLPESVISVQEIGLKKKYIPQYMLTVLNKKNKGLVKNYDEYYAKYRNNSPYRAPEYEEYIAWGFENQFYYAVISNIGIRLHSDDNFIFTNIKKISNNKYECIGKGFAQWDAHRENMNMWDTYIENTSEITNDFEILEITVDGDYLCIFNKTRNRKIITLVAITDAVEQQFIDLFRHNTCDLSNVTFPRRADKTHSVGATCVVAESLRLRKEENTSSATIQIMQPGTQVQIQQLGKKETIDGISANWVQVQLADGNIGWCFGGWLVEK